MSGTSRSSTLQAKKIKASTPQSIQLETFVKSLGIIEKAELYSCNELVYINTNIILPVLSVTLDWFLKNAETPMHYIKIGKNIYINKYGMTKLLGQSKEAVSFRLQDYLYDLFYTVESKGTVEKKDLVSRAELIKALKLASKTTEELLLYQSIDEDNKKIMNETVEEYNAIRCDNAILTRENNELKERCELVETELDELKEEHEHIKNAASVLAKYVRIKSAKPPVEAYDDIFDIDEDENPESPEELDKLTQNAAKAKSILKKISKPKPKEKLPKAPRPVEKVFCLMRSAFPISNSNVYKWDLSDKLVDDEFKENSKTFLLDDDETIFETPTLSIWYCDLSITAEKSKAILLFLSLAEGYEENVIIRLLE